MCEVTQNTPPKSPARRAPHLRPRQGFMPATSLSRSIGTRLVPPHRYPAASPSSFDEASRRFIFSHKAPHRLHHQCAASAMSAVPSAMLTPPRLFCGPPAAETNRTNHTPDETRPSPSAWHAILGLPRQLGFRGSVIMQYRQMGNAVPAVARLSGNTPAVMAEHDQ